MRRDNLITRERENGANKREFQSESMLKTIRFASVECQSPSESRLSLTTKRYVKSSGGGRIACLEASLSEALDDPIAF